MTGSRNPSPTFADLPHADLCLVSCVKTKKAIAAPARQLYTSDWFRKARQIVERMGWRWCILSAKHGLVDPDQIIEPYDKKLDDMKVDHRREWARDVIGALEPQLAGVQSVVFFASKPYREFLANELRGRGIAVHVPMHGLRSGEQNQWMMRLLDDDASSGR